MVIADVELLFYQNVIIFTSFLLFPAFCLTVMGDISEMDFFFLNPLHRCSDVKTKTTRGQ